MSMNKSRSVYMLYNKVFTTKDNGICIDYVYLTNSKNPMVNMYGILRIKNVEIEFYCAKPPGIDISKFEQTCIKLAGTKANVSKMKFLDSQFYTFNKQLDYIKFSSSNTYNLKQVYDNLLNYITRYYTVELKVDELKGFDKIFYEQTESPLRFTSNCFQLDKLVYVMSSKFNIPNIGPVYLNLNADYCDYLSVNNDEYINNDSKTSIRELVCVDYDDIKRLIKPSNDLPKEATINNLKIMSYDIETYNNGLPDWKPESEQPIICIGIGVFNINEGKPIDKYSIISSEFDTIDFSNLKYTIEVKHFPFEYKLYKIHDYKGCDQPTKYIIVENEKQILQMFIYLINSIKPFTITGFNNWQFDDIWIAAKLKKHELMDKMLSAINIHHLYKQKENKLAPPVYGSLSVKLDGEVSKGSYYSFKNSFTSFHDAMFSAVKEDPKRFNQRQSKKLNNMLAIYDIEYPYEMEGEGQKLQKTGLDIPTMFKYWASKKHIYQIARYCCQDAWITGTLAIKRYQIGDLIEMSNITYTTFADSLLKAVNIRVASTLAYYAYHENFAFYDTPDRESRAYQILPPLGGKYYDRKKIRGGAVKNKKNGREKFIVALDFSSMYPSQKEGSNVDTSSRVDEYVIEHPEEFDLKIIDRYFIEDMYCEREFLTLQSTTNEEIKFEVEENFAEYKLDKKFINLLREQYKLTTDDSMKKVLLRQVKNAITPYERELMKRYKLHSENDAFKLVLESNDVKIPFSVNRRMYFCQSPKDEKTLLPTVHYALKEKMLSDFRAKRNNVKKQMKTTKDATILKQLSAKEKAIKVVMNSEYGQTGSETFAYFDPDIGAAVTFASRHCIQELTSCLNTEHFYVTKEYENNTYLNTLIKSGIAKFEKIKYVPTWELTMEGSQREPERWEEIQKLTNVSKHEFKSEYFKQIDYDLPPRRITTWKLYTQLRQEYIQRGNIDNIEIYRITLPKSDLVYQDTDSNYYTNNFIVQMFPELNPTTVNQIMKLLMTHNNLLSNLIPDIIHRPPIGVGFEGAFIVARYLNKKKKYYGKKWNDHMNDYLDIPRPKDYIMNDYEMENIVDKNKNIVRYDWKHLPDDYETYLIQKSGDSLGNYNTYYTTIPFKDGSFMSVDMNLIGEQDHLDYVNKNGIKCTGVDLARRDQYKVINYNHLRIFKEDLKYTDETGQINVVNDPKKKFPLLPIINKLLLNFVGFRHKVNTTSSNLTNYEKVYIHYNSNEIKNNEINILYRWADITDDNSISEIVSDVKPSEIKQIVKSRINYPLEFYQKIKSYKPTKQNGTKEVVANTIKLANLNENRGLKDKLLATIPEENQRMGFIILNPLNDKISIEKDDVAHKGILIDTIRVLMGDDKYIYPLLDYQMYFKQLATSLCNYAVVELKPDIINYLDEDWVKQNRPESSITEITEEMGKEIKKVLDSEVKKNVKLYFPFDSSKEFNKKKANNNQMVKLRSVEIKVEPQVVNKFIELCKNCDFVPSIKRLFIEINGQNLYDLILNSPKYYSEQFVLITSEVKRVRDKMMNDKRSRKIVEIDTNRLELLNELFELSTLIKQGLSNKIVDTTDDQPRYVKMWLDEVKDNGNKVIKFNCDQRNEKCNKIVKEHRNSLICSIKISNKICDTQEDLQNLLSQQLQMKINKSTLSISPNCYTSVVNNIIDLLNLLKTN